MEGPSLLSKVWRPVERHGAFYNEGRVWLSPGRSFLYCQQGDYVNRVQCGSGRLVAAAGLAGSALSTFAASSDGRFVITASKSVSLISLWEFVGGGSPVSAAGAGEGAIAPDADTESGGKVAPTAASAASGTVSDACPLPPDDGDRCVNFKLVRSWKGPSATAVCRSLEFDSTDGLCAAGYTDGSVIVYAIPGGYATHSFRGSADKVTALKFHPARLLLYVARESGFLDVFDLYRYAVIARLQDHTAAVCGFDLIVSRVTDEVGGVVSVAKDGVLNVFSLDASLAAGWAHYTKAISFGAHRRREKCKTQAAVASPFWGKPVPPAEAECLDSLECGGPKLDHRGPSLDGNGLARGEPADGTEFSPEKKRVAGSARRAVVEGLPVVIAPVQQIPVAAATGGDVESLTTVACMPSRILDWSRVAPDGAKKTGWLALTGAIDGKLHVWHPVTRQRLAFFDTPHADVGAVSLLQVRVSAGPGPHDAAGTLLTAGEDSNVILWDMRRFKPERVFLGKPTELLQVAFVPVSPAHRAASARDACVPGGNEEADAMQDEADEAEEPPAPAPALLVLRGGRRAALLEKQGAEGGERYSGVRVLEAHGAAVVSAAVSPEGCFVATGSRDGAVQVHCCRTGTVAARLGGPGRPAVVALAFARRKLRGGASCVCGAEGPGAVGGAPLPSGSLFLFSADAEGSLKSWTLDRRRLRESAISGESFSLEKASRSACSEHSKEIHALAVAPSDGFAATAGADKTCRLWRLPDLKPAGVCAGHRRAVHDAAFSPVEKIVATAAADGTVKLWDLATCVCLRTLQDQHAVGVQQVRFLANGAQVLAATSGGKLKLWTVRTGSQVGTFAEGHVSGKKITSLSLSSCGSRAATCGADDAVTLWADATAAAEREAAAAALRAAEAGERVESLARGGRLAEALALAVRLRQGERAARLLRASFRRGLLARVEAALPGAEAPLPAAVRAARDFRVAADGGDAAPLARDDLSRWCAGLDDAGLAALLALVAEWNGNGRSASLANALMEIVLKEVPSGRLLKIEALGKVIESFNSCNARHVARVSTLVQRTFLLDVVLFGAAGAQLSAPDIGPRLPAEAPAALEAPPEPISVLTAADVRDILFG